MLCIDASHSVTRGFGLHRSKIHPAVMDEAKAEFQHATLFQENDEACKLVDVQVSRDGTWTK